MKRLIGNSLLVVLIYLVNIPVGKTEITTTSDLQTGTVQQLEGVYAKDWTQWFWAAGGQQTKATIPEPIYSIQTPSDQLFSEAEIRRLSQEWENIDVAETQRSYSRLPIAQF